MTDKNNTEYNYVFRPNKFKEEKEDHYNIHINSETKLGRLLDPSYLKIINYPHIGKFNSVMNLWYWVRTDPLDDSVRRLKLKSLKRYASTHVIYNNYVENFKAIIGYATWLKLQSYPEALEELKQLDPEIKFLSYYVIESSGIRISTNYSYFMVMIAETIRKALRENKEPNFNVLADNISPTDTFFINSVLDKIKK